MNMSLSDDTHTIARLFGDAVEQMGKLLQNEAALAQAEISEKLTVATQGLILLVMAAVLAIPVLVVLLIGVAIWFSELGLSPVAAHFLAALAGAIVSIIAAVVGKKLLSPKNLKPVTTLHQLRRDAAAVMDIVL
jgi:hypothetical protein